MNKEIPHKPTTRVERQAQAQQQQLAPISPEFRDTWKRSVASARIMWSKLTIDELLETKGDVKELARLVEQRYALTSTEAKRRVTGFMNSCHTWY